MTKLNVKLLPIKLHYFFFWGGIGSAVIFVPLLAKDVGINASAIGIMYTVSALMTLISQPGFGAISDHFQNSKHLVMLLVVATGATLYSLLYIPPIAPQKNSQQVILNCTKNNFIIQEHPLYNSTCISFVLKKYCIGLEQERKGKASNQTSILCNVYNDRKIIQVTEPIPFDTEIKASNCKRFLLRGCIEELQQWIPCDKMFDSCFTEYSLINSDLYWTYQVWIFSILTIISQTMMFTCFSLSDAMCYELLEQNKEHHFGWQRLWSMISYGIASFAAGYFNDLLSHNKAVPNYSPGFYIMLGTFLIDLVILYKMPNIKVKLKSFSLNGVRQMISSSEVISAVIAAFLVGVLTAIIWSYQFLFLESIGASQTLLGLTSLFQCIIADVLFLMISGWIVQKIGYFLCLLLTFSAFALRFFLYVVLQNPWHMLPVEILDGVTFALFYVTLTGFAKVKAPLGVEATMVGLLVASFEGLGVASGNLLGGISYDYFGARRTFLFASIGSASCTVIFPIIQFFVNKTNKTKIANGI